MSDKYMLDMYAQHLHNAMERFEELKETGRLWVEAINKLADMDEHTPERRVARNTMLDRLDKLEAVFRRILVMPLETSQ